MSEPEMIAVPAGKWEELNEQIKRILELVTQPMRCGNVLPRAQAIAYVWKESESAFDRWCADYGVKPCSRGRYSKARLDIALAQEAGALTRQLSASKERGKRSLGASLTEVPANQNHGKHRAAAVTPPQRKDVRSDQSEKLSARHG